MNKRLAFLEQHCANPAADSFAFYGLGMEYRKEGRIDDAIATFDKLKAKDPDYVAMYLMAGQTLIDAGRGPEARIWLEAGIAVAQRKHDSHALGELESALASV
ncbi:MAG TPA: tetratricopeptide repeat protein [Polyangiaceae bacterium]|jgi:tetratricopeptide (TPR) repeat protein|nr:tetratricopeptide repeat protein [Polyangiaceae bacterium]